MEVYVDVLFLENCIINYIILEVTSRLAKSRQSGLRTVCGASIGALYTVLIVLFPYVNLWYSMAGKLLLSFLMVSVSFGIKRISEFFKMLIAFYISTFIFAGAAFAFIYFKKSSEIIGNGIVYLYWQSKWSSILLAALSTIIMVKILLEFIQIKITREKLHVPVRIVFEKMGVGIEALIDTGNSLSDPLSGMPVIVVEFAAIKKILPVEIFNLFDQSMENDLVAVMNVISNSSWFSRFRIIPFTSLGKENGVLIGFKPDYIEIGDGEKKKGISNVIVGIYNKSLSKDNNYNALVGLELCSV